MRGCPGVGRNRGSDDAPVAEYKPVRAVSQGSDPWSAFITRQYGRKMGFVRHCSYLMLYHLRCFRSLETVDWNRVKRLVFVCKGNICRSPYAEAKARALGLAASSFGLQAAIGGTANAAAAESARRRGVDLSEHKTSRGDQFPLIPGDLLMGMEPWHARA